MSIDRLTKTCSNCGLIKPLSAFLQFSGTGGGTYSNICSSCRKVLAEKKPDKDTTSESSSTSSDTIDSKRKMQSEITNKQEVQRIQESYKEDRENLDQQEFQQISKIEKTAQEDKLRREKSAEKTSFLERKPAAINPLSMREQQENENRVRLNEDKEIRLDVPFIDTQIIKPQKYGTEYAKFQAWLSKSPGIAKQAEKALENNKIKESLNKNSLLSKSGLLKKEIDIKKEQAKKEEINRTHLNTPRSKGK